MSSLESSSDPRRWWSLAIILTATFMAILDTFVVNVAIPSIQRSLHSSFAQVELVIASYTVFYAVMLVTGGRLGDRYGRKKLFQIGMLSFILASLLCGLAPDTNVLIIVRIFQGIAAALMIPQVISLIQVNFTGRERGTALGFYGATIGLASISGQIVGGLLISSNALSLGWRSVFLVNLPIGVFALIATFPLIRETASDKAHKLDLIGVGILTLGLLLLTYPLIEGHDVGWPFWIFVCLILSVPTLISFVLYERHLTNIGGAPLIPLTLFQHRSFNLGILTSLAYYSGNGALFFILALYLQFGLAFSALSAGLTFLPLGLGFFLSSLIAPRLVPFMGNWVMRSGAIIMAIGELWTLFVVQQANMVTPQSHLLLPLLIVGLGEGSVAAPLMNTILAGIQSRDTGAASGILTTTIQISQAMGVALIGIIFFSVLGQPAQKHPQQLAHAYGQAFVTSVFAITILAIATLLFISLLPALKREKHQISMPTTDTTIAPGKVSQ